VIPKAHGAKLTDIPDDQLEEILVCYPLMAFLMAYIMGKSTMSTELV